MAVLACRCAAVVEQMQLAGELARRRRSSLAGGGEAWEGSGRLDATVWWAAASMDGAMEWQLGRFGLVW